MGNKVFDAKIIKTFLGREEHGIFTVLSYARAVRFWDSSNLWRICS